MQLLGILEEDLINYKKISMTLEFPFCSFKCNKDNGCDICQNSELSQYAPIDFDIQELISRYLSNSLEESIVMQGLEPLDSFDEVLEFIEVFRQVCNDDIVIYTGYEEYEIQDKLNILKQFSNIIIKVGRFKINSQSIFDNVLGITLNSDNQYAFEVV